MHLPTRHRLSVSVAGVGERKRGLSARDAPGCRFGLFCEGTRHPTDRIGPHSEDLSRVGRDVKCRLLVLFLCRGGDGAGGSRPFLRAPCKT
jgi:hypothetical protein